MAEVSVVVPTIGRPSLLREALRGALGQCGVDLEVLVVQDGPGEGSADVVQEFGDARVRLLRHDRRLGIAAARNTGIASAGGKWIALLDDDDLWGPNKLVSQLEAARGAERLWAYTGSVGIDPAGRVTHVEPSITPEEVVACLPRRNVVPGGASNVIVAAAALAEVGPFGADLRHLEDWDMFLRLARVGPPAMVPAALVAIRAHPHQTSLDLGGLAGLLTGFERRHGVSVDRPAIYRAAAWACLQEGRRGAAVRAYGRAVAAGDASSIARLLVALLPRRVRSGVIVRRFSGRPDPASEDALAEAQAWVDELAGGPPQA